MPQFAPFSYGNVLAQTENIRGARTQNALAQQRLDPSSPQNQLIREQLAGARQGNVMAQTRFDQEQQQENTEQLYQALTEISENPAAADFHVPRLKKMGILRTDFDHTNMTPEEISTKARQGAQALGKSLGLTSKDFGQDIEAISLANFNKPFAQLLPDEKKQVIEEKRKSKTPLVTVSMGDKKEREEIGKIQAKRFSQIVDRGEAARDALDNINQLEAIDIETGALEPMKASFAAVIDGLGFDASGIADVSSAQAFKAVSNRMVNDVLNRAKGPQTEQDAARARSTIASLGSTPKANEFINATLKALALRQIQQQEFIEQLIDQGKSFSQANKQWNEFKRNTPSLSSVIKTPDGLPVFFYQFKERARRIRPDITDDEIIEAWRSKHGK